MLSEMKVNIYALNGKMEVLSKEIETAKKKKIKFKF